MTILRLSWCVLRAARDVLFFNDVERGDPTNRVREGAWIVICNGWTRKPRWLEWNVLYQENFVGSPSPEVDIIGEFSDSSDEWW